jgi:PST family polysaccharide transporter
VSRFLTNQINGVQPSGQFRTEEWFDLKAQFFRGGAFTLSAQAIKFCLQLGSVVILARLLTPEDYGMFGIVIAIIVFINLFKDMGLPVVTIQRANITHVQISNLFWINTGMGIGFALILLGLAPLIGWVYHEPRLVSMLVVMSLYCVVGGISAQPQALLKRNMKFKALAFIEVVAMIIGVFVAVTAAWYRGAYWSLVYMHLAIAAVSACGALWACKWLPSFPRRNTGTYELITSGAHLTITAVLTYAARNVDTLLIGWSRGTRELGFYDKAYQLLLLPILQVTLPISGVALSVLSKAQANGEQHRRHHAIIILLTASLGMAFVAFLFANAENVIGIMLGPQWMPSVPIFLALAPAAFVDTFLITLNWVLISLGQTKRLFRMTFAVTLLTVAGFFVGLPWGALGVATAFSACRVGSFLPMLIYVCRHSQLHVFSILRILFRPTFASVMAAGGLWVFASILPFGEHDMIRLILDAVVFGCIYLGLWVALPGGTKMLRDIIRLIPILWRGGALSN